MPVSRRRPGRVAGLNRETVVAAAIDLVEREGAAALTMRRLAEQLGVEAMSLYHHVRNRDELLDAIGEQILSSIDEAGPQASWAEACRAFGAGLRSLTLRHPESFRLIGLRPLVSAGALAPVERLLQRIVAAGVAPPDALAIYRAVASYARGYALAEVTGFTVDAATPEARRPLQVLPGREFPVLHGEVMALAAVSADDAFELGLDALLRGLAAGLA